MSLIVDTTTLPGYTIVTDPITGGIQVVIDSSAYLNRMAVALETISTNSTTISNKLTSIDTNMSTIANKLTSIDTNISTIANKVTSIDTNISTIATKLTSIEDHQHHFRTIGDTTGIHFKSPYDDFSMISIYKLLIEQGKLSDLTDAISQADQTAELTKLQEYVTKVQSISSF